MIVEAQNNSFNVKIGDIVRIYSPTSEIMKMSFIAYVIPLILIGVTIIGGTLFFKSKNFKNYELLGMLSGIIGGTIGFFAIRILGNKKANSTESFKISGIVKKAR